MWSWHQAFINNLSPLSDLLLETVLVLMYIFIV